MTDTRARLSRGLRTSDRAVIRRRRQRLALVGVGAAALVVLYAGVAVAAGGGIPRGTTVLGVDIGGMSAEEAQATLERELGPRAEQVIPVRAAKLKVDVVPADAGLVFDASATVAAAGGRSWNPITLVGRLVTSPSVEPVVTVDEARMAEQIGAIAAEVDDPAVEPRIVYSGVTPKLREGRDGEGIDRAAAAAALTAEFLRSTEPIVLPIGPLPRTVSPEAAKEVVAGAATVAVSAPVTVTVDGSASIPLQPEQLAEATAFRVVDGALVPQPDGAALHDDIRDDLADLETPGRDARIVIVSGKPVVKPSKEGNGVPDAELADAVAAAMVRADDRVAAVTISTRPPELTTEEAEALGVTERLSTYTEEFPYAAYREQNIGQAARYLNGTILLPGETFSMNDTIGERTEANGYTKGFVVGPGGVFAEELGGGVSTATTAMWGAAFYAGLERVFTRAHSIWISRYTAGLEATVAWGQFDMKFRNDTPNGVLITASTTPTSITVSLWGTKEYDDIEAEFGPRQNIREFETIYDESDDCLGQYGVDGFSIDVDRVFIKDGEEVKRETITTVYNPSPTVVCGPDPDTVKPSKSPKPSASETPSDDASGDPDAGSGGGGGQDSGGEPAGEPESESAKPKPSARASQSSG